MPAVNDSIDVWFIFGSFVYGLEARPRAYSETELHVVPVLPDSEAERSELSSFLDTLTRDPRGLLRSELRIYSAGLAISVDTPVRLFTEAAPVLAENELGEPVLEFRHLQGLTPPDTQMWLHLAREVWAQDGV